MWSPTTTGPPWRCGRGRGRGRGRGGGELRPRHLAWAQTQDDHTWTPAQFLDERSRQRIGNKIGLAMNSRGQAVAAWSASSVDEGGSRWLSSPSRDGLVAPRGLTEFAFQPAAVVTESGTSSVALNLSMPPGWAYWRPGLTESWVGRSPATTRSTQSVTAKQMETLRRSGRNLITRFLLVTQKPLNDPGTKRSCSQAATATCVPSRQASDRRAADGGLSMLGTQIAPAPWWPPLSVFRTATGAPASCSCRRPHYAARFIARCGAGSSPIGRCVDSCALAEHV